MWTPQHHHAYGSPIATARQWVPELSSLAEVVILRCAKLLATSVGELQKIYQEAASNCSKVSHKFAVNFLEYCCFKALATATQNTNFLKDKQFRHLSFEMMLAWESPDSVVVCFKKIAMEREYQGRMNNENTALSYSTLIPLLVHQRSTVGKEAFVRIAPAMSGVADVLSAHFLFNALAGSTGGRLPFRVYDKYLMELDKALDKLRHQRNFHNNFFFDKGENVVEVEDAMSSVLVIQHAGVSTWPGRLILTDHSLYFEPAGGLMAYGALQKWDLAADLQQIVEPCAVNEPWSVPFFEKAISYKSVSDDEHVILEFPEFLGCSRRDYWLMIIQEILYTHQFIRNSWLRGAGQVEAVARSMLSIIRFKAIKEALRANPPQPKLLLCFSMFHVLPSGNLLSRLLVDKLKKESSLDSREEVLLRRLSYSKSAASALYNSRTSYPRRKRSAEMKNFYIGEFFLDEISHVTSVVAKSCSFWTKVNGSEIILSGEKADNLSVNFAIIKAVFLPLRPTIVRFNALLSWDEPSKTIAVILLGSSVIMRELLQYVFAFLLVGVATFILFKQAGEGSLPGSIDILSPSQSTVEEMRELQAALNGLEELLKTSNIILLRLRALLYSVFPKATDQVVLFLIVLAGLVMILPAKMLLLLLFWEIFTRKLPLREENSEYYRKKIKAWWSRIPIAPVCFVIKREYRYKSLEEGEKTR